MIHQSAEVHYTTEILNPDGTVAARRARKRNLILDGGLDMVASMEWARTFEWCAVGTGTRPTKRDSGSVTFTRTGSAVIASASFFESQDVGRRLKFDTGEEMRITAYTSSTEVTVDTSGTLAASEGTVWYTNEAGHEAEVRRTNTYVTGVGNCGTTYSGAQMTMKRTYIFPAETGAVTYREIGWAPYNSGALFGRDLIPGVGDSLIAGQQYRVACELTITVGPFPPGEPESGVTITGLPGLTFDKQLMVYGLMYVSDSGGVIIDGTRPGNEPRSANGIAKAWLSTRTDLAWSGAGNPPSGDGPAVDAGDHAYVAGTFERLKSCEWDTSVATTWRSILLGFRESSIFAWPTMTFRANAVQTKAETHRLIVAFRFSWGRTLVN